MVTIPPIIAILSEQYDGISSEGPDRSSPAYLQQASVCGALPAAASNLQRKAVCCCTRSCCVTMCHKMVSAVCPEA